jgi:ATP synthase protein I
MRPQKMAEKSTEKAPGAFSLLGTASTMGLHMVSGPVVGGGLGWLIAHWLESWPIASAIGLVLGLVAGFRNVWADARYLERSNAVIDAEKKKKEEEQGVRKAETASAKPETANVSSTMTAHSAQEKTEEKTVKTTPLSESRDGDDSPRDNFTASVLAGTASPEERELEELDETMEAIRRVLENGPDKGAGAGDSDNAEKGQA